RRPSGRRAKQIDSFSFPLTGAPRTSAPSLRLCVSAVQFLILFSASASAHSASRRLHLSRHSEHRQRARGSALTSSSLPLTASSHRRRLARPIRGGTETGT